VPNRNFFHLHLVSDATGETLITVARATLAQFPSLSALEHNYVLVRSHQQLDRVMEEIEANPGIVLYTIADSEISARLSTHAEKCSCPCLNILEPVSTLFQVYLGATSQPKPGAQHTLNSDYFRRIDALNYTMIHDDGQNMESLTEADVVLLGVSRTSKTPTCIYLANRGVKAGNIPLVAGQTPPNVLESLTKPLIVGLVATPERILQIRQNRLLSLKVEDSPTTYTDREEIAYEVMQSRRLFENQNWPVIDVTRRSIEETAADILDLFREHKHRTQNISPSAAMEKP
jgi:regulator of PEP synthase PpsR (kinase-PPPase family)